MDKRRILQIMVGLETELSDQEMIDKVYDALAPVFGHSEFSIIIKEVTEAEIRASYEDLFSYMEKFLKGHKRSKFKLIKGNKK